MTEFSRFAKGGAAGEGGRYALSTINDFSGLSQSQIADKLMSDYPIFGMTRDTADGLAGEIEQEISNHALHYMGSPDDLFKTAR